MYHYSGFKYFFPPVCSLLACNLRYHGSRKDDWALSLTCVPQEVQSANAFNIAETRKVNTRVGWRARFRAASLGGLEAGGKWRARLQLSGLSPPPASFTQMLGTPLDENKTSAVCIPEQVLFFPGGVLMKASVTAVREARVRRVT